MIHPRYVIPSIISILGLCVGLSSIKFALNSQFEHAVIAITIASIIDTIDGRIARLIKGTSKFGAELDSLIDFINFGVAPAIAVYIWILKDLGNIGWLLVCVAISRTSFVIGESSTRSLPPTNHKHNLRNLENQL